LDLDRSVELWIPITIAAAFLQNLRSALQKHLKGQLGTAGATYVRFAFGVPFAILYVLPLLALDAQPAPRPGLAFVLFCMLGGLAQILGTAALIHAFSFRNFAVGTALSKTEVVQTAIFAILILGEPVSLHASAAILVCLAGVVALSLAHSRAGPVELLRDLCSPAALSGIGSGAGFGIAAVSYRAAALSLASGGFLVRAALTLACVIVFQTLVMTAWIAGREPGQLTEVWRARGTAVWVGLFGMAASAGWFTAMTIQNAALVRALGQIELVFTFAASY
jgi:drug/metabolite transporter (DMT)-like permease